MKIICDNCGAKYSIADEKVRGKVFKIRCKKCSHIIVVRGSSAEPAEPAAASAAAPASGEAAGAVWHLVVGRDQVGPVGADEVRRRFAAGDVNSDSYIWREGFADWLRLNAVSEFADLLAPQPQVATPASAPPGAEVGQLASAAEGPTDLSAGLGAAGLGGGAALAAAAAAPADAAVPAQSESKGAVPGLFGGAAAAEPAQTHPLFGDEPAQQDGQPMTGQRGENSVLFSLANLQQLALGSKPKPQTTSSGNGARSSGSGLIDIRAMAAGAGGAATAGPEEELPALSGFSAPVAAAPVLVAAAGGDRPKWLVPVLVLGGGLLVVAIVLLVFLLAGRGSPPLAPSPPPSSSAKPKPASSGAKGTAKAASAVAAPAKTQVDSDDPDPSVAQTAKPTTKRRRAPRKSGATRRGTRSRDTRAKGKTTSAKRPRRGRDSLDDLLDGALKGKRPSRRAAAASNDNLPESLSRSQIQAGMRRIKGRVQNCYDRFKVPGQANVKVKIGNTGRVVSSVVKGIFAGTPTGACVLAAVRSARFPRFSGSPISITYPFVLR